MPFSVAVVAATDPATVVVTAGAVMIVCAPPADVEPVLFPREKVKSVVASALMLIVFPAVAVAARSAVMKMYPVLPELMAWVSEDSEWACGPRVVEIVPSSVSLPNVLSAEYQTLKFTRSAAA